MTMTTVADSERRAVQGECRCPVCGESSSRMVYPDSLGRSVPRLDYGFCAEHGRTYEIRRCANCTHVFAIVTALDLWKNYRDVVDMAYLDRAEERALTFRKLVERIRGFVPSGKLLDIGCATGDFLDAARAYFDVEGVELSTWSSRIAMGRGFRVHTAGLESIEGEGLYDVATLWGVIGLFEHVDEEVARITRLLKPGGVVCIWTGDMDSWLAKALGRRYWYVMGQYLQLFTKRSLCTLFERHGYERRWMGTYPFTSNFRLIGNSLGRYRVMGTAAKALLHHPPLSRMGITLLLPGEMFAIFRKAG